jgi:hypothetical protein
MKQLFYFGCMGGKGHYWFPHQPGSLHGVNRNVFGVIDGTFTPGYSYEQGAAQEVIIGPLRIIAWHDYSVDTRPGSHSTFVGYGYDSVNDMLTDAAKQFPAVMNRQPKPTFK